MLARGDKTCFRPHRYESTSSDDSSSESSDEGSDSSEYHEAREKLPESTLQNQQLTHTSLSQLSDRTGVPQQAAASQPSPHQPADTRQPEKPFQSPAADCPPATDAALNPASEAARVDQPSGRHAAAPPSTEPASEQTSTMSPVTCSSSLTTVEITKQQHTVQSGTAVQAEQKPPGESSDAVSAPATPVRVELSDGLMSALHILQKALGEPNAFSHQAAVSVFIC